MAAPRSSSTPQLLRILQNTAPSKILINTGALRIFPSMAVPTVLLTMEPLESYSHEAYKSSSKWQPLRTLPNPQLLTFFFSILHPLRTFPNGAALQVLLNTSGPQNPSQQGSTLDPPQYPAPPTGWTLRCFSTQQPLRILTNIICSQSFPTHLPQNHSQQPTDHSQHNRPLESF